MENIDHSTAKETIKSKIINSQYFELIKGYKTFDGRTDRNKYWAFILLNIIISTILSFVWSGLGLIFQLFVLMPNLAASIRRLHDVNKEWWFIFIPIYNLILLFENGTDINVTNDYGLPSKDNKIKINTVYILAFLSLLLIIGKSVYTQQKIKKAQEKKEALYITKTSESDKLKLQEQNKASLEEVEQAQTIPEILKAYVNAPKGSESSLAAATKWISLCNSSIEIKDANSYFAEYSEARTKALEKWKELSTKEIEQAQTIQEAKIVYENAPDDNDLKTIIYNKWNELSLVKVEQVQTVIEAKEAYDNSPAGSQARTKALEKWKELSTKEIEQAQNFESIKNLYGNLPDDETIRNKGITKWISLCQTAREVKEVYANTLIKNDLKKMALDKWKELSAKEIEQAKTVDDLKNLYSNLVPDDSKLKSSLLTKWISLCQTAKEMKEVYANTSTNSEERKTAFNKWNDISLKEIEQANTLVEVTEVYNNTPENSQSRKIAAEKISELK